MLRVTLAGGIRVEVDGRHVDERSLGGRQGRHVLARLAWEQRPVHRDELADGIWLDRLPRTWERTLSGVITRLHAGLAAAGFSGNAIVYADGRYNLRDTDIDVDVHEAHRDLVAAGEARDAGDLALAKSLAESALDVARLPVLTGADAGWVELAHARHRSLLLDALDLLAGVCQRSGAHALAESTAREAIHWDPLRESGHRRLLEVLAASGDHAAVLQAYASLRRLLAEELGASPSPSTEAVYLAALGTEPALTAGDIAAAATPAAAGGSRFPPGSQRTRRPWSAGRRSWSGCGHSGAELDRARHSPL